MNIPHLPSQFVQFQDVHYLRKWLLIGGLIGVVAGVGSILFMMAISGATHLFQGLGADYSPPLPIGESPGGTIVTEVGRRWMIPVITTVGGLLSAFVVFRFAPEAEGHGTDAAIDAFHRKEGMVRGRIPIVKIIASAITIGSGGSAGREGPTAQIAAGFGSVLGQVFHLTARDRRIAVAAGIGAGIGSIFKAPFGGAILSTEILYLEGFEIEALVPAFIASTIGYVIFATWAGYGPIFGEHLSLSFNDPYSLLYFVVLGLFCGIVGMLYPRTFYAVRDFFRSLPISNYFKPAIGGLAVGLIGLFVPQILGMGYGWIQLTMTPQIGWSLGFIVLLALLKVLATSLSIGSGGSGGVFAPGLFIGGMIGAALWVGLHNIAPHMPVTPVPFVVVGMMALFGGAAHAPLAVMLMVGEMTGSYEMLAPAMVAVGISYVIVGKNTIYESQVKSPAESPAHRYEYSLPLLSQLRTRDAMRSNVSALSDNVTLEEAEKILEFDHMRALPVVGAGDQGIAGVVALEDILRAPPSTRDKTTVTSVLRSDIPTVRPDQPLDEVLDLLGQADLPGVPVVEESDSGKKLVGMVSRDDIAKTYSATTRGLLRDSRANQGDQRNGSGSNSELEQPHRNGTPEAGYDAGKPRSRKAPRSNSPV